MTRVYTKDTDLRLGIPYIKSSSCHQTMHVISFPPPFGEGNIHFERSRLANQVDNPHRSLLNDHLGARRSGMIKYSGHGRQCIAGWLRVDSGQPPPAVALSSATREFLHLLYEHREDITLMINTTAMALTPKNL